MPRRRSAAPRPPCRCGTSSRRFAGEVAQRPELGPVELGQEMAELLALGPQVADVLGRRRGLERYALDDRQAVALETGALGRVVREQAHRAHPEDGENLRSDA